MMTFAAIEALFEKHAPLYLKDTAPEKPKRICDWQQGEWKPPTSHALRAQMKQMRREGMTIGDIARACKVTWRTAWKHSNINGEAKR
jgi:hypothetical protein